MIVAVLQFSFRESGARGRGVVNWSVLAINLAFLHHLLEYSQLPHFIMAIWKC